MRTSFAEFQDNFTIERSYEKNLEKGYKDNYKPPMTVSIEQQLSKFGDEMIKYENDCIIAEVQYRLNIDIDERELLSALRYDRNSYERGFNDAIKQMENKITTSSHWKERIIEADSQYTQDVTIIYCSNCQKNVKDKSEYCPHCGRKMNEVYENESNQMQR